MSRFIVTSGSDFRPFSYDELMKPVQASAEAHAAAADAYDQLSMETEALGRYISQNDDDAEARALYDNYVKKLGDLQNNLWSNGFTARTRRDLSSARSAYANDITRLKSAIEARQERSKEYWDARHKNPDLVTGFDPRIGGLDNYLRDSEYGRDWYSYSGTQFANEVGAEAKARAAELFDLYTDKANAPGYLMQIQQQGFTNAEVDGAGRIANDILAGKYGLEDVKDSPEKILAGVLVSRLASTGAVSGQNISPEEYNRLFNYGRLGLSQGVGEVNKKLLADKQWELSADLYKQRESQRLKDEAEIRKAAMAAAMNGGASGIDRLYDTYTPGLAGENYEKAQKELASLFGENKKYRTPDGRVIEGGAAAAELIYSADKRREAYKLLGFDIGRTAGKNDKQLSGEVTRNGITYETIYDPSYAKKGAVLYRIKGSGDKYRPDGNLTDIYNSYRKDYEDVLSYYKKSGRDVYNAGKNFDPDKQYEKYTDVDLDFMTPITSYGDYISSVDANRRTSNASAVWMVRNGETGSDYIPRFAGWLTPSFSVGKDGTYTKDNSWRDYDGQTGHIHRLNKNLVPTEKTVLDPNDAFNFDKQGRITNINGILLDENAIMGNYLIFQTTKGDFAVGLDMLGSDILKGLFVREAPILETMAQDPQKERRNANTRNRVIRMTDEVLRLIGKDLNLQSQGPTNKDAND